jgi:UDP:flavonoid glycosyltransferase YjiC (YdhE family)
VQGLIAHDEVTRSVRVLEVTWDGSGNLPPFLGLTEALVASGHQVTALAHRTQQAALQAAGADVYSYASTGEFDSASSENRMTQARWLEFNRLAPDDVRAAVDRCRPDVLIIDCMMPDALRHARSYARPVVSLVHSAWQIIRSVFDGVLRAPNEGVDLLVVTGYRGFHEGDAPPQMVWVGPLRATPKERQWPRRAHDRPLVLTSLSSGHQNQEETLRNVCAALSESPVEAIVTVGRGFDPASIAAGANVYLERTVPHEHILGDASLLITHAGHGTAMMGLRFGVPMLCLPGVGDQPAVAERIVALGLGEILDKTSSSKTIARAVTRLLADSGTRDRARAFAHDAANHPGVDLAIARIEDLQRGDDVSALPD